MEGKYEISEMQIPDKQGKHGRWKRMNKQNIVIIMCFILPVIAIVLIAYLVSPVRDFIVSTWNSTLSGARLAVIVIFIGTYSLLVGAAFYSCTIFICMSSKSQEERNVRFSKEYVSLKEKYPTYTIYEQGIAIENLPDINTVKSFVVDDTNRAIFIELDL